MYYLIRLSVLSLLFFLVTLPAFADHGFVGSETCGECHQEIYSYWYSNGHHKQLRDATVAKQSDLPLPEGYTWDDISYVVGGHNKKAIYVDLQGYLITKAKNGKKAPTQYNLVEKSWEDYLPGQKVKYDCAFCHTTGYQAKGHQDGRPGITGVWEEDGIGCEACHGPGRDHVEHPRNRMMSAETAKWTCAECHQRGGITQRPLDDVGLVQHHEQINQLKAGAHKGLSCTNCHRPHTPSEQAKRNCTICHSRLYATFVNNIHEKSGVSCVDCHMAEVDQSAISRIRYFGDTRTHVFKIETDPAAEMFETVEENGKKSTFIKGFLTVDNVCLSCHEDRDKSWAVQAAKGFHGK